MDQDPQTSCGFLVSLYSFFLKPRTVALFLLLNSWFPRDGISDTINLGVHPCSSEESFSLIRIGTEQFV
jgi:hypothetical protein